MRHSFGLAAQGGSHNRLNLLRSISWFATAPGSYFPQPVQALLLKARSPEHYRFAINLQPCRNLIRRLPFGRGQGGKSYTVLDVPRSDSPLLDGLERSKLERQIPLGRLGQAIGVCVWIAVITVVGERLRWPRHVRTLREALDEAGVPSMIVNSLDTLLTDAQLQATGFWKFLEHPTEGTLRMPDIPTTFSASPGEIRLLPPRLGEHSIELLREAGFAEPEIQGMLASGVTRTPE